MSVVLEVIGGLAILAALVAAIQGVWLALVWLAVVVIGAWIAARARA